MTIDELMKKVKKSYGCSASGFNFIHRTKSNILDYNFYRKGRKFNRSINLNNLTIFDLSSRTLQKEPELKVYTYNFQCPNIEEVKTEEDKEYLYNKVVEEFQYKLKELIK